MPFGMKPLMDTSLMGDAPTYGSPENPVMNDTLGVSQYQPSQEKKPLDTSAIPGFAALLGAAIAGPKSGLGNMLAGGAHGYASDMARRQQETSESKAKQHSALVSHVYGKVTDLASRAPDHPGVKELNQMLADALADDQIISPKEAADMSVKIHSIEGSVADFQESHDREQKKKYASEDASDKENRDAWKMYQILNPSFAGTSFEDASKNKDLLATAQKTAREVQAEELSKKRASEATGPWKYGGQEYQLPISDLYHGEQADKSRNATLAGQKLMANYRDNLGDNNRNQTQQLEMAKDVLKEAGTPMGRMKMQAGSRVFDPSFVQRVQAAQGFMQQLQGGGGASPQGGSGMGKPGELPPELDPHNPAYDPSKAQAFTAGRGQGASGKPSPTPTPTPMSPPPEGPQQGMAPPPGGAAPTPGGKPLPPGVDPSKMTPQQKMQARAQGYMVP